MGFDSRWIDLVMKCVSSVSFSIILNGNHGSYFNPSRRLRQGDPISPYLFLLVSDALSRNITNAANQGTLQGINLSRGGSFIYHFSLWKHLCKSKQGGRYGLP